MRNMSQNHKQGRRIPFCRKRRFSITLTPRADFLLRIGLGLLVLAVLVVRYPYGRPAQPVLKSGDIAPKDIIAPFTFPILKGEDDLDREREQAASAVPPVLDYDVDKQDSIVTALSAFESRLGALRERKEISQAALDSLKRDYPNLSPDALAPLLSKRGTRITERVNTLLAELFGQGVIADKSAIPLGSQQRVLVRTQEGERLTDLQDILDLGERSSILLERLGADYEKDEQVMRSILEVADHFLKPNLVLDLEETNRRREDARKSVSPTKGIVLKGEIIVRAHARVTPEMEDRLRSLNLSEGSSSIYIARIKTLAGTTLLIAAILSLFVAYLWLFHHSVGVSLPQLSLLAIIGCMIIIPATVIIGLESTSPYLIPVATGSILVALLLGSDIGIVFTFILAILISIYSGMRLPEGMVALAGGTAAVLSVRGLRRRSQFYRSILWIASANIVAIAAVELLRMGTLSNLPKYFSYGIINAGVSGFVAMGLLPIFEHIFGISTNIRLLELSDLNHPLLRRLSLVAPGTYHHSIIVGNLAEAAAEAVGANSLLARVGACYHDIGKMRMPAYFSENQIGIRNPHEKLSPKMSALIITSHVKDGIEMARKARLPQQVIDIIQQHHGTTLMVPFYEKARQASPSEKIDDITYRYPGPHPKTKEAAIVMLADSIEATARSLDSPNPNRIKGVIKSTIRNRLDDSQLDECALTLSDLHKIGEKFLPILIGVFHPRLEYPTREEEPAHARSANGLRNSSQTKPHHASQRQKKVHSIPS
jgi:putative nucleotidyltransferase with HDIG domain